MSVELIILIIVVLVAAGVAALRKVRTGSFGPMVVAWQRKPG